MIKVKYFDKWSNIGGMLFNSKKEVRKVIEDHLRDDIHSNQGEAFYHLNPIDDTQYEIVYSIQEFMDDNLTVNQISDEEAAVLKKHCGMYWGILPVFFTYYFDHLKELEMAE